MFALFALLEVPELAVEVVLAVALVAGFLLLEGADEGLELLAGAEGGFLFGLGLLDGADGVLHLAVGPADDFGGLAAGFVEDVLAQGADVLELLLVFAGDAFEGPVGGADLLELLVEGAAVAGDLAEVALDADVFFAGALFRIPDQGFRQAGLAGQFEGEGVAGQAGLQLEEGKKPDCLRRRHPYRGRQ